MDQIKRLRNEIEHFSALEHIWWGARTKAGQARYDHKLEQLKQICRPKKGDKILEIGCGDGEFTRRLATLDCNILATDITKKVVDRGRKFIKGKNIKFKVDNGEKMTSKSNYFDIVCGISILHHLNPEKALKEAYRVLKLGGQIFFTEPNLLNPHIFIGLNISALRSKMEYSPDETALIRWQVEKILKNLGFSIVLVKNHDFLHPKTPDWLIGVVMKFSNALEKMPIIKEISGSLIIWAKK